MFSFQWSEIIPFSFTDLAFGVIFQNSSLSPESPTFPSVLFSRRLLLLHFTLRSMMCFELFFVKCVRPVSTFIVVCLCVCMCFMWISVISSAICLKVSLFIWISLPSFSKFSWMHLCGSIGKQLVNPQSQSLIDSRSYLFHCLFFQMLHRDNHVIQTNVIDLATGFMKMFILRRWKFPLLVVCFHKWMLDFIKFFFISPSVPFWYLYFFSSLFS